MRIKRSYLIATGISILIVAWFVIGSGKEDKPSQPEAQTSTQNETLPKVVVRHLYAETHENYLKLHGRTEPVREVSIKAETAGLVVKTPVREGRYVKRGTLLCAQDIDARAAQLDQAKATLRARELEYQAAQKLVDKGFRSPTQAAAALAAFDGAKAAVKQAEIELGNVNMRAPFSGIFEKQIAEIGDYLAPGQACGLLVDLDPLIVAGDVTEKQVSLVKIGQNVEVTLATGEVMNGKVRLVETKANPATRTFRVEVELPNKNRKLKAGVTSTFRLSAGQTKSHFIPASVQTLDDEGKVGVRYVDFENRVHFVPVTTIDENESGIWVKGLPDEIDLIVKGQDYVDEGTIVDPEIDDGSLSDAPSTNGDL
ncbi:MAG TPA: efflux RND transporter periplasmic adaptor subunit [Hellea balneolensis]|uniref:Efflux RND transporter periplasmic adaptor subunit n=1 Tax=Hellea balneolensis TaxID=287478 RepID=A0A7C5LUD1_9PROT|nr:efflux RND transporter periplasmic adaptor subunit [Hellea balneolensis]